MSLISTNNEMGEVLCIVNCVLSVSRKITLYIITHYTLYIISVKKNFSRLIIGRNHKKRRIFHNLPEAYRSDH